MTKKLFFIGIISLFLSTFTSCFNDDGPGVKVTVEKTVYQIPDHGTMDILFNVNPATYDASKSVLGIQNLPKLITNDPNVTQLVPTVATVTKSLVGEGKWIAHIKLINQDGKDFVPGDYDYKFSVKTCIILANGAYCPFFDITYEHKAK